MSEYNQELVTLRRQVKEGRQLMAALVQSLGGEVEIPVKFLTDIDDHDRLKVWESDDRTNIRYLVYRP